MASPVQHLWGASVKCKAETGFRSPPEAKLSAHLERLAVAYTYEAFRLSYVTPQTYIPDFGLPLQCLVLEVKGYFAPSDRTKMLRIRAAHPHLDIRFLFTNPNTRISRGSKTTYGAWCDKHGFPFAKGPYPPDDWLSHRPSPQQQEAFEKVFSHGNPKKH